MDNKIQNAALSGIQNQKCFDANWLKTEILYMLQKIHIYKMNTVNQNKIYYSIRNSHYWYSVPSVLTSWPQGFIHIRLKILSYNAPRKESSFMSYPTLTFLLTYYLGCSSHCIQKGYLLVGMVMINSSKGFKNGAHARRNCIIICGCTVNHSLVERHIIRDNGEEGHDSPQQPSLLRLDQPLIKCIQECHESFGVG